MDAWRIHRDVFFLIYGLFFTLLFFRIEMGKNGTWIGKWSALLLSETKIKLDMKKRFNPKYEYLSEWADLFADAGYFENNGELLYDVGRNVVKRFRLGEMDVVVKRFGRITAFNRLMYATVRESKAMRAYKYASKLRRMGISTPEEVAVLETHNHGMVVDSYFISVYSVYSSLSYLRDFTFEWTECFPLLDSLAVWIFDIHSKGILHQDLNVGNILYQEQPDGGYSFQLIDNNRMKFRHHLSVEERLKDICKLSTNFDLHHYLLKKYVQLLPCDGAHVEMKGCFYKLMLEYRQMAKQKAKKMLGRGRIKKMG